MKVKCEAYGCVSGVVWDYDEHGHTTGAAQPCKECNGTGLRKKRGKPSGKKGGS